MEPSALRENLTRAPPPKTSHFPLQVSLDPERKIYAGADVFSSRRIASHRIAAHRYRVHDWGDMSWIWEKSPTWRWIVRGTRGNPLAMGAFTLTTMFAIPIGLGSLVMSGTNPEVDDAKMAKLRRDAGLDTKIMVGETPPASSPRALTPRARPLRPTLTRRLRPSHSP